MSETPTVPPYVNSAMKRILRSPVHGMVSKTVLLITFTGRKSGKTYTTPVSYSQHGDQVTLFTHADWWKNLCGGATVSLRIRGRDLQGLAEPVAEDKRAGAARRPFAGSGADLLQMQLAAQILFQDDRRSATY